MTPDIDLDALTALVDHLDEWDGECDCGIEQVTAVEQQLLTMFDAWYGDKAYRKHDEIIGWAAKLTEPLLSALTATRAELDAFMHARIQGDDMAARVTWLSDELVRVEAERDFWKRKRYPDAAPAAAPQPGEPKVYRLDADKPWPNAYVPVVDESAYESVARITASRAAGAGDGEQDTATTDHPENTCHRCGEPNITWSAPSPLWNEVMRGGDINATDLFDGIVCPTCFAILAEKVGVADLWQLSARRVHAPLQTVTPSGRTWNEQTWTWDDDAVAPASVQGSADGEAQA